MRDAQLDANYLHTRLMRDAQLDANLERNPATVVSKNCLVLDQSTFATVEGVPSVDPASLSVEVSMYAGVQAEMGELPQPAVAMVVTLSLESAAPEAADGTETTATDTGTTAIHLQVYPKGNPMLKLRFKLNPNQLVLNLNQ